MWHPRASPFFSSQALIIMPSPTLTTLHDSRSSSHEGKRSGSVAYGVGPSAGAGGDLDTSAGVENMTVIVPSISRGVRKMQALQRRLNLKYLSLLYGGFALLAFVMSLGECRAKLVFGGRRGDSERLTSPIFLVRFARCGRLFEFDVTDQYTSGAYLTNATSVSFQAHSTLATIRTLKSVFQAVSQPPIAKISDVAGRVEAYVMCVVLYAVGYAIAASANSIYTYAVGNSIYVLGITGLFLLQNIIISEISSTRNRLFWSIFPSIPGTINVWVSGNITASVLETTTWRWGLGMFCILVPAMATPIILTLTYGMRPHKKHVDGSPIKSEKSLQDDEEDVASTIVNGPTISDNKTLWAKTVAIFWSLDLVGLLFLVGGAGMVLVTITIANGRGSKWSDPHCIALLTVGGLCVIAFVLWEAYGARHPLIPFSLMTNRTVIIALIIAVVHPAAGGAIGSYFFTFLRVAANQSNTSATRIVNLASFTGTLTAAVAGVAARYIRYLKPIILFGFTIEVLSFGLMIRYRQSTNSQADLAMVQVVRGFGVGCIGFPVQAAIQTVSRHEHIAAITAGYLTIYYLSSGIGSAIGGGIWTNLVPDKLAHYMPDQTLVSSAYQNPIGFIARFAPGTPERLAVSRAHDETQRIIVIAGTCIAALGLIAALFLENVRLTDSSSIERDEEGNYISDRTPRSKGRRAGCSCE
ncbi:BZ3500_MvSof-1268-A1-R1_Chr6-3g08999 [Microbotryum saponariae]|uniref:BZ3500_MvSof-1268-A1-R1_Chr6-3g08999 protein n=1 Tax=Microbotryum saponariae TaxID=289078 RepID=A0A2X0KJR8_9BASI|nr:BZ3500_MvSof-1268-A1-R1_Chr6-3g08999 [Microbotryum saponariae]SDA07601.1 BZ3501_MvSof-1269-A2-R1_Chr6-2g08703 [Microbotryum saponariae]